MAQPKLIIHGGAGSALGEDKKADAVKNALRSVAEATYLLLQTGSSAEAAVIHACALLEDDPLFNAGTGSVLQSDGQIRMSASLMVGHRHSFSGVINVSRVQNPIHLAKALQASPDRVVAETGAVELARELGVAVYNPMTAKRLKEWLDLNQGSKEKRFSTSVTMGTVGAVALDQDGTLAAATSTGGRGYERIGRVSDSAMPAGNYAGEWAAVSCTGVGEDIIDEGLATRIVVRVTDGILLSDAMNRSFTEARSRQREFGAIALAKNGDIAWDTTTDLLLAAYHDGERVGFTFQ
jgi:L-asparaginase